MPWDQQLRIFFFKPPDQVKIPSPLCPLAHPLPSNSPSPLPATATLPCCPWVGKLQNPSCPTPVEQHESWAQLEMMAVVAADRFLLPACCLGSSLPTQKPGQEGESLSTCHHCCFPRLRLVPCAAGLEQVRSSSGAPLPPGHLKQWRQWE